MCEFLSGTLSPVTQQRACPDNMFHAPDQTPCTDVSTAAYRRFYHAQLNRLLLQSSPTTNGLREQRRSSVSQHVEAGRTGEESFHYGSDSCRSSTQHRKENDSIHVRDVERLAERKTKHSSRSTYLTVLRVHNLSPTT